MSAMVNLADSANSTHMEKAPWGGSELTILHPEASPGAGVTGYLQVPTWATRIIIRAPPTAIDDASAVCMSRSFPPDVPSNVVPKSPQAFVGLQPFQDREYRVSPGQRIWLATGKSGLVVTMEFWP